MAYSDSDALLAAALAQLAREQGDPSLVAHSMVDPSGSYIPHTDTEEPHNTNPRSEERSADRGCGSWSSDQR